MLIKRPRGWGEGKTIFHFLRWLGEVKKIPGGENYRMADPGNIPNSRLRSLYEEFLGEAVEGRGEEEGEQGTFEPAHRRRGVPNPQEEMLIREIEGSPHRQPVFNVQEAMIRVGQGWVGPVPDSIPENTGGARNTGGSGTGGLSEPRVIVDETTEINAATINRVYQTLLRNNQNPF